VGIAGANELLGVKGVGPWTASYVAMRSGDDDAFLPTDLGVKHGLAALGQDPKRADEVAEAWRPYRALGVAHLWAAATPPRRSSPRATA
jgi:AraC family transcriptional regulator of adaptative response / DNA-3-methyladenine glycosylase II